MTGAQGSGFPGPQGGLAPERRRGLPALAVLRRPGGIGVRVLTTLFFLMLVFVLNCCGLPTLPPTRPAADTSVVEAANAVLRVEILPDGAKVVVDGLASGRTPVSIELPPGQHEVRVELEGYEPLQQTVTLTARSQTVLSGELPPSAVEGPTATSTPTPAAGGPLADLVVQDVRIELATGGACDYRSTQLGIHLVVANVGHADAGPFIVEVNGAQQPVDGLAAGQTVSLWFPGYSQGGQNTVAVDATNQVEESNEEDNAFSQQLPIPTLPATCTAPPAASPAGTATRPPSHTATPPPINTRQPPPPPTPSNTPTLPPPPAAPVTVREGQVQIATYPYARFVTQAQSEDFHMSYPVLDRGAYDSANPLPAKVTYRTLVLENEFLRLTLLPDVGGRIYEVYFKPTGHDETYRNPVLKPSHWGPAEESWWLAAGGIEWALPVAEHGYEWAISWTAEARQDAKGATVILRDSTAPDRVRAQISVRLEAGAGFFTVQPRLENPTGAPLAVKYWSNAMLAPGGRNAPSADLRFVLPDSVTAVTIHSRGDDFLPDYNQRMAWPVYQGRDLSRLGNWNRWLGFFEDPASGDFAAVYDESYDEGFVLAFPADAVTGLKVFGMGWSDAIPPSEWTDDNSSYVEVHSGPASTFDDSVTLPASGHLQWTETFYPAAGLGGLRYANATAALNLAAGGGQVQIGVSVSRAWSGDVVLLLDGRERLRQGASLVPGQALRNTIPVRSDDPAQGRLTLRLETSGGGVAAETSADLNLK
jgi:hypothetical protein